VATARVGVVALTGFVRVAGIRISAAAWRRQRVGTRACLRALRNAVSGRPHAVSGLDARASGS